MYEEHEDGSFTLHMCEWYEQGRRLVGEYETLGDGSGFAVTDEWSTCSKVVVNHPSCPASAGCDASTGRSGPTRGCTPTTTRSGSGNCANKPNATGSTASCDPWERWATGNPSSADSRATGRRLRMAMMACLIHERTKGSSMMTGYAGHPA